MVLKKLYKKLGEKESSILILETFKYNFRQNSSEIVVDEFFWNLEKSFLKDYFLIRSVSDFRNILSNCWKTIESKNELM